LPISTRPEIVSRADAAFQADREALPTLTLRGGAAVDSYDLPPPYDPQLGAPSDAYFATYAFWGLGYLDPASWRHYLPQLIDYTFRHIGDPHTMAPDGLLSSLRPPDRDPPRLASLTPEQEAVIVAFLENLAFSDDALYYQADAMQILDEWWLPNALYRNRPNP
jgi:hypothetical protein